MSGWQDISTAPKDGRVILGLVPGHGVMAVSFSDGEWQAAPMPMVLGVAEFCDDPTHWMPLPEPPKIT